MPAIANRTTSIDSSKTVGEIQAMLAASNATSLMIDYSDGQPTAVTFELRTGSQSLHFRLPCNWQGVLAALKRDKKYPDRLKTEEQAKRVAWRVLKDWLRAQLSIVEAGNTTLHEVMVPWLVTDDGSTVATRLFSGTSGLLALPDLTRNA
jgi:hypothetical protein